MPVEIDITDAPRQVAERTQRLVAELDRALPAKALDRNLLVATWNLRMFGGLTKKWISGKDDSPARDFADVLAIAAVISRFDVVAVQEVRDDLRALRRLMQALGPHWGFTLTDVTLGSDGNYERLAYLFDTRRVRMSGLACELVEPPQDAKVNAPAFAEQFARTPYAVSFIAGGATFLLVTLHVKYGEGPKARVGELRAIADWLAGWAAEIEEWGHNLICLGDFNIDQRGDALFDAFTSTGLRAPAELDQVPRTIFDQPQKRHFYDQIAWFVDSRDENMLNLSCSGCGSFDFVPLLQGQLSRQQLSFHISDHYPLWAEFALPPRVSPTS